MSAVVIKLPARWSHPCDLFVQGRSLKFCSACGFSRLMHKKPAECSACGSLYAAKSDGCGYSHCIDHQGMRAL